MLSLSGKDPLEEGVATHSRGLQSLLGEQRSHRPCDAVKTTSSLSGLALAKHHLTWLMADSKLNALCIDFYVGYHIEINRMATSHFTDGGTKVYTMQLI